MSSNEQSENNWATPMHNLSVPHVPEGAINLNIEGREAIGPLQGFGQLWQKTYSVRLAGAADSPQTIMQTWKEEFGSFWPSNNRFYATQGKIAPGELAILNLTMLPGMSLSTGVRVIYADESSFTFMEAQGHIFAGLITFSTFEEQETPVAQIQMLMRASDPLFEMMMRLRIGHVMEDQHWRYTLQSLAKRFGVVGHVEQRNILIDRQMQWSKAGNLWYNAAIRSALYSCTLPLRWAREQVVAIGSRK